MPGRPAGPGRPPSGSLRRAAYLPSMAKMRKKSDLPQKTCACCGKPFAWRRKWARDWDRVRYCSDRCRREARSG